MPKKKRHGCQGSLSSIDEHQFLLRSVVITRKMSFYSYAFSNFFRRFAFKLLVFGLVNERVSGYKQAPSQSFWVLSSASDIIHSSCRTQTKTTTVLFISSLNQDRSSSGGSECLRGTHRVSVAVLHTPKSSFNFFGSRKNFSSSFQRQQQRQLCYFGNNNNNNSNRVGVSSHVYFVDSFRPCLQVPPLLLLLLPRGKEGSVEWRR